MEDTRETCCKKKCDQPATLVIKAYVRDEDTTGTRAVFMPFCMSHMLDVSRIVESLVASMIAEDEDE